MNTPVESPNSLDPKKPLLLQPKTKPDTPEHVQNILDTPKASIDSIYINDTMMKYFHIANKLDELSILFPEFIEREWSYIIEHAQNFKNAVFSGWVEPDETAMLTWYQENGKEDLEIVSDAVQIVLSTVIDTYPEHPIQWLAYMQYEELFWHPASSKNVTKIIPQKKYKDIFPSKTDDSNTVHIKKS